MAARRSSRRAKDAQDRWNAVQEERDKQYMELHGEHRERLDGHDKRFERMHLDYVPRTELQASMDEIRKSADRQERWLEFLVKKEVKEPKV